MKANPTNAKGLRGQANCANQNQHSSKDSTGLIESIKSGIKRMSKAIWLLAYSLEETRQDCGAAGHLWKQAGCCIALAFLRLAGGRI